MKERERPISKGVAPEAPTLSREPLIELPDRNISLIYINHGTIYNPFPNRETIEKEVSDVFGEKIEALAPDSFPNRSGVLTPTMVAKSLNNPIGLLNFGEWAIRYAVEKDLTIIGADPVSRSPKLEQIIFGPEAESFQTYLSKEYVLNIGKYAPEYKSLESSANTITALRFGVEALLGLQFLRVFKKIVEKKDKSQISRRDFIAWTSTIFLASLGTETFLQIREDDLSVMKSQFLKSYLEGYNSSLEIRKDAGKLIEIFSKGVELSEKDFADPLFQRRMAFNHVSTAALGLRNALTAEVLTSPLPEILPWINPRPKANILAAYGLDHVMVPENMRISYFIKNDEERKNYIRYNIPLLVVKYFGPNEKFLDGLRNELAEGISYKINKDGAHLEHKFKLKSLT